VEWRGIAPRLDANREMGPPKDGPQLRDTPISTPTGYQDLRNRHAALSHPNTVVRASA
jgi:hypothetical protein